MPRSNRPRRRPAQPSGKWSRGAELDLERARFGIPERQSAPDGEWNVRRITQRNAVKDYSCPGCGLTIAPGVEHVVAWREDSLFGAEAALSERRHWHHHCWKTRSFRYRS
jgi:hypothetical protein